MKLSDCYYSSSPWGFRFFPLEQYCLTLKSLGVTQLCFMTGAADGFPQALKGGSKAAPEIAATLQKCGVMALEVAMALDGDPDEVRLIGALGARYLRICEVWERGEVSFAEVVKKMQRLSDLARRENLTVIVENHGGLLANSDDCRKFFTAVDRDNVTLNYDAANFLHFAGEDPLEALKKTRQWVGFTHLKSVSEAGLNQGKFCRVQDGVIDYRAIFAELASFYHGCLCCEYEMPEDVIVGTADDLRALQTIERG